MTQEEKQLLLKDLCARLPYGVICTDLRHGNSTITDVDTEDGLVYCFDFDEYVKIENCRLYLRPMSSMTDEEKEELKCEHIKDEKLYAECLTKAANGDDSMRGKVIPHFAADWCNKNHFDFRGLIPMGLALEAPVDMYKTE